MNKSEEDVLLDACKIASSKAIRSSKALGLTIKVIRNSNIISISPDNTEEIIGTIPKTDIDISSLKKGMILERNKI